MLVEMGAMDKKLVGSHDWIGANEVGYCLQKLYGVWIMKRMNKIRILATNTTGKDMQT
jgi:hypothetical protein